MPRNACAWCAEPLRWPTERCPRCGRQRATSPLARLWANSAARLALAAVAVAFVVTLATRGERRDDPETIDAQAPSPETEVTLRFAVSDERSGRASVTPTLALPRAGEWTPDLTHGGDLWDVSGRARGPDTLAVYAAGRDRAPLRVPLLLTDSLCQTPCARDIVHVVLSNDRVEVVGTAVVGTRRSATYAALRAAAPSGVPVSRDSLADAWPLSVSAGWIDCIAGQRVVFRTRRASFALNGTARSAGYAPIEPIWKYESGDARLRVNIGPLLRRGLALCDAAK